MKGINWYSDVNYWCMIVSNEYKLPLGYDMDNIVRNVNFTM
jgi:hypothetical protein